MKSLPAEIYSVATVRDLDRTAIEEQGIAGYTLMTRAAAYAVDVALDRMPHARRWQVLCGAGNNAGDGYVVARLARAEGVDVTVVAVVDPAQLSGDAKTAHTEYITAGGEVTRWTGSLDPEAALYVDGLLGSGLDRPVDGDFAAAVAALNTADAPVVAQDQLPADIAPSIKIDRTRDKAHGDLASNIALTLAKPAGELFLAIQNGTRPGRRLCKNPGDGAAGSNFREHDIGAILVFDPSRTSRKAHPRDLWEFGHALGG